jgi:hypothetical protein
VLSQAIAASTLAHGTLRAPRIVFATQEIIVGRFSSLSRQ